MIKEILTLLKLEEIVAEYIKIEDSSKPDDLRALCPFHTDKNPSFSINPKKQVFYCHGCKQGGNVITFVSLIEGITNEQAIELLKEKAGITTGKTLLSLMEELTLYYESKRPQAQQFFESRSMSPLFQNIYRLGYSGSDALELYREFSAYKSELKELQLIQTKYEGTPSELNVSFFSNRVMVPIITHHGVVGFAGRTLIDNPSKYLNSFDNPYFHRRKTLYGINKKAIDVMRATGFAYLVEGLFDVGRMQSYGYYNTIGSLGTGLTVEQAIVIKRYCNHVYILYDGDSAGTKASVKASQILISVGLTFDVIFLPKDIDPDSYLLKNKTLDDLEYSQGIAYFKEHTTKEEFIEIVKQSPSAELIPDALFREYQIPRWTIKSKPMQVSLNTKKLTKYTNEMHLALFLDCFPIYETQLSAGMLDTYIETRSLPEVINLYFNNPYKSIKDSKEVFNLIIKEIESCKKELIVSPILLS